jgi:predicted phage baseplate assembly protein
MVTSLLFSGATDQQFSIRRDENDFAFVVFGDGKYGKIPRRGVNNIKASYLVGGGAKGNVPARSISKIGTALTSLKLVLNEAAANGGADSEPIADAVLRGPQQFRSSGRAVTAADYEFHAKLFGVAKVRAFATGLNTVQLVVAPAGGGLVTDTLKHDLVTYFDSKRMLTTVVDVVDPTYVNVVISANINVNGRFFNSQIKQEASDALAALWAFDVVDFGQTLFISKIYEAIEAIDGVDSLVVTQFVKQIAGQDVSFDSSGALRFAAAEIPIVNVNLIASGGRDDG